MGVQNEFMSEHKTTGDVFNPTLPNIPFNARKNFCLDDCKLTVKRFADAMAIPKYFIY